jgi:hypothetical protein
LRFATVRWELSKVFGHEAISSTIIDKEKANTPMRLLQPRGKIYMQYIYIVMAMTSV